MHTIPHAQDRRGREHQARHQSILKAANDLFVTDGFHGTTMQMISDLSGFSVGYLYKHFPSKQDILDELSAEHLDVYEGLRAYTRSNPDLSPLDCLRQELDLLVNYMSQHRSILTVFAERDTHKARHLEARILQHRRQDAQLLEKAMMLNEVPKCDATMLSIAIDSAIWGLLKEMVADPDDDAFNAIPAFIDAMVFKPLVSMAQTQHCKD